MDADGGAVPPEDSAAGEAGEAEAAGTQSASGTRVKPPAVVDQAAESAAAAAASEGSAGKAGAPIEVRIEAATG